MIYRITYKYAYLKKKKNRIFLKIIGKLYRSIYYKRPTRMSEEKIFVSAIMFISRQQKRIGKRPPNHFNHYNTIDDDGNDNNK